MVRVSCIGIMNLWHPFRGAGVFVASPEVSAIAATSGYCLPTLRVEEPGSWKGFLVIIGRRACHGFLLDLEVNDVGFGDDASGDEYFAARQFLLLAAKIIDH